VSVPAFSEQGAGDIAVVMLHGVGGAKEVWAPQIEAIGTAGYRAIAWDMPGYGGSPAIEPYDMAGLVRSLEALLDALAAHHAVLLGHSMGGMVAQEAMIRSPQQVAGLILSATSPAFGKADGAWQQDFLRQRLGPLNAGRTMAEVAAALVPDMIGADAEPAGVRLASEVMARVPPDTYRKALHAIVGFDRRAALPSIRVPTLAIAGERDRTAPPAVMEKMASRIPDAEYTLLTRCGHLANLERPRAFNGAVLDWLKKRFPS